MGPHKQHKHPNQLRWLVPPSRELIRKVIADAKVSIAQFERFHGMTKHAVANTLANQTNRKYHRDLPAKYWHLFYEDAPQKKTILHKPKKQRAIIKKIKPIKDPALLALGIGS